jgi:hypothetical protein
LTCRSLQKEAKLWDFFGGEISFFKAQLKINSLSLAAV